MDKSYIVPRRGSIVSL